MPRRGPDSLSTTDSLTEKEVEEEEEFWKAQEGNTQFADRLWVASDKDRRPLPPNKKINVATLIASEKAIWRANLRSDQAWGHSGSGTIRKGGHVLAGTREGARQSVRRRQANGCN